MSPTTPHPAPLDASRLLEALDPDQREVAEHLEGPLCVLAGAGTGKTRAITYRIAHGVATGAYQATQVLAVTFTARAAGEMRSRLADLGVPGVQARRSAPAHLLLAHRHRRTPPRHPGPQGAPGRRRRPPPGPAH